MLKRFFSSIIPRGRTFLALGLGLLLLGGHLLTKARFQNKNMPIRVSKLSHDNLSRLDGIIDLAPIYFDSQDGSRLESLDGYQRHNLYSLLTDDELTADSSKNHSIRIEVINDQELAIILREGSREVASIEARGRLKKDGFFYLDKKLLSCSNPFFLLGGCYHYKARIGLSSNGNPIYQSAVAEYGAILLVIWKG